jgi:hypothetical protein
MLPRATLSLSRAIRLEEARRACSDSPALVAELLATASRGESENAHEGREVNGQRAHAQ